MFPAVASLLLALSSATPASNQCLVRVVVVNYDPILKEHGGLRLSRYMKWNDPRTITTNLVRHLAEVSAGFAKYEIVDFIDFDAFPEKRDGFCYTESSYLQM